MIRNLNDTVAGSPCCWTVSVTPVAWKWCAWFPSSGLCAHCRLATRSITPSSLAQSRQYLLRCLRRDTIHRAASGHRRASAAMLSGDGTSRIRRSAASPHAYAIVDGSIFAHAINGLTSRHFRQPALSAWYRRARARFHAIGKQPSTPAHDQIAGINHR